VSLPLRLIATGFALILSVVSVAAFETSARAAYVLDQNTGTVLDQKSVV